MFDIFLLPDTYIGLFSLALMLIILDIDNVIFISILSANLNEAEQHKVKQYGLLFTIVIRIVLIMGIQQLIQLDKHPLFEIPLQGQMKPITVQDLIVIGGGLFLMYKSVKEIHQKLEGEDPSGEGKKQGLGQILVSVAILNVVFSVDSVITAVGMAKHLPVMVLGLLISIGVIYIFQHRIGQFVQKHPSTKVLALSFLLLIGLFLVIEGLHVDGISKGYIYFAMAFSLIVELINIRVSKRGKPVLLHEPHANDLPPARQ
jgi:predicted tellurium resistance membrane protein TerC